MDNAAWFVCTCFRFSVYVSLYYLLVFGLALARRWAGKIR